MRGVVLLGACTARHECIKKKKEKKKVTMKLEDGDPQGGGGPRAQPSVRSDGHEASRRRRGRWSRGERAG